MCARRVSRRFALPKIMQELGLHRLDMGRSSAEITLADIMTVSVRDRMKSGRGGRIRRNKTYSRLGGWQHRGEKT